MVCTILTEDDDAVKLYIVSRFLESDETRKTQPSKYIYILDIFTEKSYGKSLERNAVYIPITTLSHATSVTSKNKPLLSTI